MQPFHTIAIPHRDILEGRLTLDVFAADLWEVFKGRAPNEYKNSEQFFQKTYQTDGLKNLLSIVERRLQGRGGDPMMQIQTPFGGGKTHALIAMFHKANEWNAQKVVIVGTPMSGSATLWGMLEEQLTGEIKHFRGMSSPGREEIYRLLSEHQPVLILIDELLEYTTKAAATRVEDSTLAAQTLAFMQELTEVVGVLEKAALVITLPSSTMEHYDEQAERLFGQLQKVSGRVEKIYTPVQEHEITLVIRRRLFSQIDMDKARDAIKEFMDYAVREAILPSGTDSFTYQKRFEATYPFQPEVIDTLYQRWGSFPTFQRTRGVLRLLSLVMHFLKDKTLPYISLADFELGNQEIRRELLRNIGPEYDSVIAADITSEESGARKASDALGDAYKGLKLGSRAATSIFLYSFSGGTERGASLGEVKRSATTMDNPSSVLSEVLSQFDEKLFYLRRESGKYYFTNQPNLNRIRLQKMESVTEEEIDRLEEKLLRQNLLGNKLKTFIWLNNSFDLPETSELKLVILKSADQDLMRDMRDMKGSSRRVNRNTIFFLTPLESERMGFERSLKEMLAWQMIANDKNLNLSDEQKKEVKSGLRDSEKGLDEALHRYYRLVFTPSREGFKETDLGISTFGESKKLDEVVYEKLRSDGDILERVIPLVIKERYLRNQEYITTEQLTQSSCRTPGEARVIRQEVWEEGIREGVRQGLFGLGVLENGKPICHAFEEEASVILSEGEVIIRQDICQAQKKKKKVIYPIGDTEPDEYEKIIKDPPVIPPKPTGLTQVHLRAEIPKGKVAGIMGVMNLLQSRFQKLQIEIVAEGGEMSEQEYEDKIVEAFAQLGIDISKN